MLGAASTDSTLPTVIYVVVAVFTVVIVPGLGYLLRSTIAQLKDNTEETNQLATTVERIMATQQAIQRDIERHERRIDWIAERRG